MIVLGLLAHASLAEDWPTYLGNSQRTGTASQSLDWTLSLQWTVRSTARPELAWSTAEGRVIEQKLIGDRVQIGDALPVVAAGDRVFFGSPVDHQIYGVHADSGQIAWRFFTEGPVRLAPTVHNDRVYVGSDDGHAYCLDAEDGKLLWKIRAAPDDEWLLARGQMISRWPVRTNVLVRDGVCYFGAGIFPHENVYLIAADAETGEVLWRRDNLSQSQAGQNDLSPQGYLATQDGLLVVPSGRSLPGVFDLQTGEMLHKRYLSWRREGGGVVGGTRCFLADGQLYASGPHHFVAMDQQSGDVGYGWFASRQMAVAGNDAFVATGDVIRRLRREAYAVASRDAYQLEREVAQLAGKLRAEGQADDAIQVAIKELRDRRNEPLRAATVWETPSNCDTALIAGTNFVAAGGNGEVQVLDRESGEVVWSTEVQGEVRALAVAHGRLLASTDAGDVYCFATDAENGPAIINLAEETARKRSSGPEREEFEATATAVLRETGLSRGFCLLLGTEAGRLASALARNSDLHILVVDPRGDAVEEARNHLRDAGLYGHRVSVLRGDWDDIPFANYFANLVIVNPHLPNGQLPESAENFARFIKPYGGMACARHAGSQDSANSPARWLRDMSIQDQIEVNVEGDWALLRRGALPGAGNWTHQYGDAGNSGASDDLRLAGNLGVLWYGDPGPGKMMNRHEGAVGPVAAAGRLFVQGTDTVMAYDAYNGLLLWETANPESIRTGVFQNVNPSNLVATAEHVFVMMRERCVQLDAATGELLASHALPLSSEKQYEYEWGYVGVQDGVLLGTATMRPEVLGKLRRRGRVTLDTTDAIFAIDLQTGDTRWIYHGQSISHHTIALAPGRVYFIDSSLTSQQRAEILRQDKTELAQLTGEARQRAEDRLKRQDLRMTIALDVATGEKLWEKSVDVTDCSEVGIGGGKLTLIHKDGVLLLCGANANGHYWRQFVAGEFSQRRLVALSATDGYKLWDKDANYRNRPIVIGEQVLAEPWIYDLQSGQQKMRQHPLTGEESPWSIMRTGHHCGMITATPNLLMFRSGFTGFYDLREDAGVQHFAGHRLGCWINAIPANGLLMIPEASAGCVCLFSIASTVVLEPRPTRQPWAIASAVGSTKPVRHLAVNFGAPGDRRDASGKLWISHPRNRPYQETGLELDPGIQLEYENDEAEHFASLHESSQQDAHDIPSWVWASAAQGVRRLTIPLRDAENGPGTYRVALAWSALEPGNDNTEFEVRVQGDPISVALGDAGEPVLHVAEDVAVERELVIEFPASRQGASETTSWLNAVEITLTR